MMEANNPFTKDLVFEGPTNQTYSRSCSEPNNLPFDTFDANKRSPGTQGKKARNNQPNLVTKPIYLAFSNFFKPNSFLLPQANGLACVDFEWTHPIDGLF
jgi:hypothetical protein